MIRVIFWLIILFNCSHTWASQTKIYDIRVHNTLEKKRIVIDLSKKAKYTIFQLNNPNRLVVDIKQAKIESSLKVPKFKTIIKSTRIAVRKKKNIRIVFDLHQKITLKTLFLAKTSTKKARLIIDIPIKQIKNTQKIIKIPSEKPFIIAVDAGHGGKDPGAKGFSGTSEKNLVFAIAKKLTALLNKQKNMKAIMVRKGDYYLKLPERREIARKAKADLFISIHADSFKSPKAAGASVYVLSKQGATTIAAEWLAKKENSADLIGGVRLKNKENVLASVLLDLSQTASQTISELIAKEVLHNFKGIGKLHAKRIQKARFEVLKSPDIPSILIETAYISNPTEEKRLKSNKYQYKMAKAIQKGIVSYIRNNTLALNKSLKHKISRGDTLLGIALKYGITLTQLKRANTIAKNETIKTGAILSIPL